MNERSTIYAEQTITPRCYSNMPDLDICRDTRSDTCYQLSEIPLRKTRYAHTDVYSIQALWLADNWKWFFSAMRRIGCMREP